MRFNFNGSRPFFLFALLCIALFVLPGRTDRPQMAQSGVPRFVIPDNFARPDAVTTKIRDLSTRILSVRVRNAGDLKYASSLGDIIDDHGSYVTVAADASSGKTPKYGPDVRIVETTVNLPGSTFEPLEQEAGLSRDQSPGGYYIVQFGVTATDELLDSLRAAGVEVLQYIPHQAFIVYAGAEEISLATDHSRVRWAGRYLPEHKISRAASRVLRASRGKGLPDDGEKSAERIAKETGIFDIAVFKRSGLQVMAAQIEGLTGAKVRNLIDLPGNFFDVVRVEIPLGNIGSIAGIEGVFSIEPWTPPQKEDEIAAQIVAGNYIGNTIGPPGYDPLAQFGVDGTNVTVSVVDDGVGIPGDGGFYVTGGNTVNGPLRGASAGALGHGHLQASIIAGTLPFSALDPNGYNYGLGIAPKANIINIPLLRAGYGGTEANTVNDTVSTAGPNGVRGFISNNSWGFGLNDNEYDSLAAQYDGFVRDASSAASVDPLVIVFSAGNLGNAGLTRPKVAKNIISVAATENIRPTLPGSSGSTAPADNLEQLPDFSARGPAADGRVKPDIAAPGDVVTGGRSGADPLKGNIDAHHRVSSGTSHAAPQVSGAAALFTEWWKNSHAGMNPSPALVKAALINGAVEVSGSGATSARPNNSEGWGRINLKNVLDPGTTFTYFDQDATLTNVGTSKLYSGAVADAGKPVRITLVWTDPPAAADPALVNDLDLEVTAGGSTYRGNVLSGGLSIAGGAADDRNNVENVFLPPGFSGPIAVRVLARSLNGNGDVIDADATDQHFALVVSNGSVSPDNSAIASPGGVSVITGNAVIEPAECNLVRIPITNLGSSVATGVTATLSTTTPGVTVTIPNASYPDIPVGATAASFAPFQVSTGSTVACLSQIDFVLTVNHSGTLSPTATNYSVNVGVPAEANYTFAPSAGASISPGGTFLPGSDVDDGVVDLAVPFDLSVYGVPVPEGSLIRLSSNGHIRIGATGSLSAPNNTSLPSTGAGNFPASLPVLMPYWDDLDMRPSVTNGGGIFTDVTGSPGSRTLKIEWRARKYFTGQPVADPSVNFAVYFFEGSNEFEYVYQQTGSGDGASGASATVGVQKGTTGSRFTLYSYNTASLSPGLRISASQFTGLCGLGLGGCVTTAAGVEVSGRVITADGRGVRNARIELADAGGRKRHTVSNSFGSFRFTGVYSGEAYVISASAKGLEFAPEFIQVNGEVTGLAIIARH